MQIIGVGFGTTILAGGGIFSVDLMSEEGFDVPGRVL